MSHTIAHRPHVHHRLPLLPLLVVIVAIAVATIVVWAISQPEQVTIMTNSETIAVPLVQPAAVAASESPVFRHALMRRQQNGALTQAYLYGRAHQVDGATLDPIGTMPYGSSSFERFDNQR